MLFESIIKQHRERNQQGCKFFDDSSKTCNRSGGCVCSTMAQIYGYIDYVVPKEYARKTIADFDGFTARSCNSDGTRVLTDEDVVRIKSQFSDYCWGGIDVSILPDRSFLDSKSVMDNRFTDGLNLVIHGDSKKKEDRGIAWALPSGKTMVASLALIEAIRRLPYSSNKAYHFGYTSFSSVRKYAKERNDSLEAENTLEKHWLVIDDISLPTHVGNDKITRFVNESLDEYLSYRIESKLPTILVFSFNIDGIDLQSSFGYVMSKMTNEQNAFRIKI